MILIYTHISARIPGTDEFLINAFGLAFDEITASNLVKIDLQGNILDKDCPFEINPAGFTIHSAVHEVRHDAMCVMHLHTNELISVATLKMACSHLVNIRHCVGINELSRL